MPAGCGTVTALQLVPFHISASGPAASPPTARQKAGPAQDTPSSVSLALAGTVTPVTTDHAVPFHCSSSTPPPVAMFCCPTATQNDEVGQEMAFNALEAEPDAALALVQLDALTNGGLVRAAPAGGDASHPTARAAMTLLARTMRRSPSTGASFSRRGSGMAAPRSYPNGWQSNRAAPPNARSRSGAVRQLG